MATQHERELATGLARAALKAGKAVCVFGIMNKHAGQLKKLPPSKVHVIVEGKADRANIPENTGVVLLCSTISHAQVKSLESRGINVLKKIYTWGVLTSILRDDCADLVREPEKEQRGVSATRIDNPVDQAQETPPIGDLIKGLILQIRRYQPEVVACTDTEKAFATAFMQLAEKYEDGAVPSRQVVELIDTLKAGGIIHLVKTGLISGVVLAGKQKITAYRATPFLVGAAQRRDEDSLEEMERARRLINVEPELLEQMRKITEKLQLIQELKRHLNEMHKAMKGA